MALSIDPRDYDRWRTADGDNGDDGDDDLCAKYAQPTDADRARGELMRRYWAEQDARNAEEAK